MASGAAHVALNAHLLAGRASYRSAGIHQYIDRLLQHLPAADPDFRYTAFVGEGRPDMPGATIRPSALPTRWPVVRIVWEQLVQPLEVRRLQPDLLHALAFVSPILSACPTVVTVYDLSFRRTPDRFRPAQRLYLSTFTAHACRRARRILTISESTRQDVVAHFGVARDKVDVAYPGVDARFRPLGRTEVDAFRAGRGLPERFILYLGTLEPRKNLSQLVRAFAALRGRDRGLKLVLAGARGWLYADLFKLVEALKLTEAVIFPGFVPAEELVLWYNAAAVFAYPSSYEGFGLPVVEALACGRPAVTSNISALPEAAGEAALCVPPDDVAALEAALARALQPDPAQQARGPVQAARFTWAATAAQTTLTYRRALGREAPQPVAHRP